MADATASTKQRPEKPDEEKYKAELAEAEKEWKAAQDKLVCRSLLYMSSPDPLAKMPLEDGYAYMILLS